MPSDTLAIGETAPSHVPHTPAASTKSIADSERTGVFTSLVKEDADIAGLVAYSIYKQNKLDWLQAFETAKGRVPNDAELASYIIGESTPRRLSTYRHLAEATLAGNGPDVEGGASRTAASRSKAARSERPAVGANIVILYVLVAVLCVTVVWLATHYTAATH